jgi:hypothetical protein
MAETEREGEKKLENDENSSELFAKSLRSFRRMFEKIKFFCVEFISSLASITRGILLCCCLRGSKN